MPIYQLAQNGISDIQQVTFDAAGVQERRDLQRHLRERIEIIAPGTLVLEKHNPTWRDLFSEVLAEEGFEV